MQYIFVLTQMPRGKPKTKTAVMTMRVSPQVKAAAEIAAQHEHRSVTSLVEVLIINHCKALNIHPENGDTQEPTK
jgi:predicted HicB family RNase H-like nuclease